MKTKLSNIQDIINLIDRYNISDIEKINPICIKCLGVGFLNVQFTPPNKEYYLKWLNIYKQKFDDGEELPIFLDASVPFQIQDFYKPDNV